MPDLYIGLMSGTSIDGIDAALVSFENSTTQLVDFFYQPFDEELKVIIHKFSQAQSSITLTEYGVLDTRLGHLFADTVNNLLLTAKIAPSTIKAIGSHGQTIHHCPDLATPFSLQIGDPNIIAEKTGITTVADFRRRDIACGGQGAPLVPAFHQKIFSDFNLNRCIVNIGGIANITVLPALKTAPATIIGFDTGPGNTLMDQWIQQHQKIGFDKNGSWAKTGNIQYELIKRLKQDPYFLTPPPKSTGKEYFSLDWLQKYITDKHYPAENIQASLCYLTAITICEAIQKYAPKTEEVLLCGGGTHNQYLKTLIEANLNCKIASTLTYGIHPDHVEAIAFAWLARQTIHNLPGNLKEVTGANHPAVLGGIYQA